MLGEQGVDPCNRGRCGLIVLAIDVEIDHEGRQFVEIVAAAHRGDHVVGEHGGAAVVGVGAVRIVGQTDHAHGHAGVGSVGAIG